MTIDDTRERLLEAAGQVFAREGFKGGSVRQITELAGANIAAVNYYFGDKERLYVEAVKAGCDAQSVRFPFPHWPPGTPARTRLVDFIHTMVRRLLDPASPPWKRQLMLRELAQPTPACAELVRDTIRPVADLLMGIVAELLPGVPERRRVLIAFSIIGQCLYYRVAAPVIGHLLGETESARAFDPPLLAEHITRFSLAALGLAEPYAQGAPS
jgi:AcrR family transcriptional regulator